jgi:hypothetical protein
VNLVHHCTTVGAAGAPASNPGRGHRGPAAIPRGAIVREDAPCTDRRAASPRLYAGLVPYGASTALRIRAGLGLDPWDVFHEGVSERTGLALDTVVIITGAAVLPAWAPLRRRPGLGTVSNVIVIGIAVDAAPAATPSRTA